MPAEDGQWTMPTKDVQNRRFSGLGEINQSNVKNLTLAWTRRLTNGTSAPGVPLVVGGVGDITWNGATQIKGAILQVDGVLYVTTPDNTWAIDHLPGGWAFSWSVDNE